MPAVTCVGKTLKLSQAVSTSSVVFFRHYWITTYMSQDISIMIFLTYTAFSWWELEGKDALGNDGISVINSSFR